MREAPALAGVTRDRGRAAAQRPAKKQPKALARWKGSLVGRAFARPGVTISGAVLAALMTAIVVNAVLFQNGHRSTSLFGTAHAVDPQKAADAAPVASKTATAAPAASKIVAAAPAAPMPMPPVPMVSPAPAAPVQPPPMPLASGTTVVAQRKPAPMAAQPPKPHKPSAQHGDSIARLLGSLPGTARPGPKPKLADAAPAETRPKIKPKGDGAPKTPRN